MGHGESAGAAESVGFSMCVVNILGVYDARHYLNRKNNMEYVHGESAGAAESVGFSMCVVNILVVAQTGTIAAESVGFSMCVVNILGVYDARHYLNRTNNMEYVHGESAGGGGKDWNNCLLKLVRSV